jgi:uncharacterized protein (DUF2147 family)
MRLTFLLAVAGIFAFAGAASAAEPYGVWLRPSTGSQVRFYDCGGKLCGKVFAVKDQARKAEIGKFVVPGATKSGADTWKGDLIDVGAGKTYAGVITLKGPTALEVKGCVLGFCRGETWTKVR